MIILEGPDGSGKSTLLKQLVEQFPEYGVEQGQHEGTPNRDRMWETTVDRTYSAIARDLNPDKPQLVWDRLFYSELVYAPIMGRPNAFGTRSNYVHRLIEYLGCPVIFCMPPRDVVAANCSETEQHPWVTGNVDAIYSRYMRMITRFGNNATFVYDYTAVHFHPLHRMALTTHLRQYLNARRDVA